MEVDDEWGVEWPWAGSASSMGLSEVRTEAGTGVQGVLGLGGSGEDGVFWGCKGPKIGENRNFDGADLTNDDEIGRGRHSVREPLARAARCTLDFHRRTTCYVRRLGKLHFSPNFVPADRALDRCDEISTSISCTRHL